MGLAIIAREGAAARKKAVPFGVFLAFGGLVGVLAGPELVDLYEDTFLLAELQRRPHLGICEPGLRPSGRAADRAGEHVWPSPSERLLIAAS